MQKDTIEVLMIVVLQNDEFQARRLASAGCILVEKLGR